MSIAAAYLVSEGLVLGADSSTTVKVSTPQGAGVVQLLTHSQKVFEVGNDSRLGICTWGAGSIGNISHRTIVAQLADKIDNETTVEDAAKELVNIVEPALKKTTTDFVGYYMGGWDPKSHEPACFHIEIRQDLKKIEPFPLGQCSFSGNPIFFQRVFRGFDPRLQDNLRNELKRVLSNTLPENFDTVFNEAFEKVSAPLATIGFRDLPIREAIDYVYSYLHITIKAEKFKFGPPTCGGPIEIG
ncbi:MAG TPA: hypothetical protein VI387_01190, partial [Candidatus Brocadiales bacterium]|nr:hypothetical protein [Candidatus Brocadiales bacterium]